MRVGSLCTGYGGIELGLALAGVDVDLRWCAEVETIRDMGAPNLGDITRVDWVYSDVEDVDLLTAGFPCQPTSAAGRRLGDQDPRWLWPAVYDALNWLLPDRVLIENVRNLVSHDGGRLWRGILDNLTGLGYGVRWLTLGACHVGAAHHRRRVFALATMGGAGGVERVPMSFCGAKGATVLPTPSAASYGSNQGGAAGRVGPVRRSLESLAKLLPTPGVADAQGGRRVNDDIVTSGGRVRRRGSGSTFGLPLASAVQLLPARATDDALALLPTPRATDGVNGGPSQRGRKGDLAMSSAVQPEQWGRFADAVERHADLYGPAPAPTEPNRNGAPRLAPALAEWLMCLPAGHVTAHLDRVPALRAIGNGVCPPQLAAAWRFLTGEEMTS